MFTTLLKPVLVIISASPLLASAALTCECRYVDTVVCPTAKVTLALESWLGDITGSSCSVTEKWEGTLCATNAADCYINGRYETFQELTCKDVGPLFDQALDCTRASTAHGKAADLSCFIDDKDQNPLASISYFVNGNLVKRCNPEVRHCGLASEALRIQRGSRP